MRRGLGGFVAACVVLLPAADAAWGAAAEPSWLPQDAGASELAARLLDRPAGAGGLRDAVSVLAEATAWQRGLLGLPAAATLPTGTASLAEALEALGSRFGRPDLASRAADLRAGLAPRTEASLADLLHAFVRLHDAARVVFAQTPALAALDLAARPLGWADPSAVGALLDARLALVRAAANLQAALVADPPAAPARLLVPPALAIDLTASDSAYTDDVALLVDAGGDDTYRNNAGGAAGKISEADGACRRATLEAAALVDLAGHDLYGDPAAPRNCGIHGGGLGGVGVLVDGAGDDVYIARQSAVNGGGYVGVGTLVDTTGHDTYLATSDALNGGSEGGLGTLLDLAGDDVYDIIEDDGLTGCCGASGGALGGVGFLYDAGGSDAYGASHSGTNGGSYLGAGFLLDRSGDDRYRATNTATNGGGLLGHGFLLDAAGHDAYDAGGRATNGGALILGSGALVDREGNDRYAAGAVGVNGGTAVVSVSLLVAAVPVPIARALLLDEAGCDAYHDEDGGAGADVTVLPKGLLGAQVDLGACARPRG